MMNESEAYFRALETDTLARTIWGEARGEGSIGMQAVAAVIMNRLQVSKEKEKFWWGNSIIEICQKPYQFSCWNRDDPNYRKVLNVDQRDKIFAKAIEISKHIITPLSLTGRGGSAAGAEGEGDKNDITDGATHYHAAGIYPFWARGQDPTAVIGHHIFYRILS